jgi:hypothetical protein
MFMALKREVVSSVSGPVGDGRDRAPGPGFEQSAGGRGVIEKGADALAPVPDDVLADVQEAAPGVGTEGGAEEGAAGREGRIGSGQSSTRCLGTAIVGGAAGGGERGLGEFQQPTLDLRVRNGQIEVRRAERTESWR